MKKNAFIELLRFVFASTILFFHACDDAHLLQSTFQLGGWKFSFFNSGYLSVEFFFVVSGFLMAKTAFKRNSSTEGTTNLGTETAGFLYKKTKGVAIYYFLACVLVSIYFLVDGRDLTFVQVRLPSLLFIQRTGLVEKEFIGLAWYLSSMLIGMAIIYPLLRKHYDTFVCLYGPLLGLMIIGYLIHTTGHLAGISTWIGITYKCNLRAIAELSLGATCFEVSRRLREKEFNMVSRCVFSVLAILSFFVIMSNILGTERKINDGIVLLIICFMNTLIFAEVGMLSRFRVLRSNAVFGYLGRLSMPIFLSQNIFHYWVAYFYRGKSTLAKMIIIYSCTVLFSALVDALISLYKHRKSVRNV